MVGENTRNPFKLTNGMMTHNAKSRLLSHSVARRCTFIVSKGSHLKCSACCASFCFIRSLGIMGSGPRIGGGGCGYLRGDLLHLVKAIARCSVLVGREMMSLMRAGEVRLLLGITATTDGHWSGWVSDVLRPEEDYELTVTWLLSTETRLSVLSWHEHHLLRRLARLGVLVHHHRRASAWAWVAAMLLRRRRMLGKGMGRRGGIHWHLWIIGSHSLRDPHIWTVGGLLHHHRSSHGTLWIHKLWSTLVRSHVAGLGSVELRHRLSICQLSVGGHG